MKKLIGMIVFLLICVTSYSDDEIVIYQGAGMNAKGETMKFNVNYMSSTGQVLIYCSDYLSYYTIELSPERVDLFKKYIAKIYQWDEIAKRNSVEAVNRDIERIDIPAYMKYGDQWYTCFEVTATFGFMFYTSTDYNFSGMMIKTTKFKTTDNEYINNEYPGLIMSIETLKAIEKTLTSTSLKAAIDKEANKDKTNDDLFR